MGLVDFSEPPPRRKTGQIADWDALAAELRQNPGKYGCVYTLPDDESRSLTNIASSIQKGTRIAFSPAGHYRAYSQDNKVYAAYMGPDAPRDREDHS